MMYSTKQNGGDGISRAETRLVIPTIFLPGNGLKLQPRLKINGPSLAMCKYIGLQKDLCK